MTPERPVPQAAALQADSPALLKGDLDGNDIFAAFYGSKPCYFPSLEAYNIEKGHCSCSWKGEK